jgi:uncharacterized protein DUF4157
MSKTIQKSAKTKHVRTPAENGSPFNQSHPNQVQDQILTLQRNLGNQGVGRLLATSSNHSEAGVRISEPANQLELRADQIAAQTDERNGPYHSRAIQKFHSPPQANVSTSLGAGDPLPEPLRVSLEPKFGHDLSQVRVHTGGLAAESAKSINASAFTVGQNIVFGPGQYSPETSAGQHLITHEMAHVVQQGVGVASAHGGLPLIQRSPGPPANLDLPWTHGDHSLFEVSSHGVRVLVGVAATSEASVRKVIPKIAERVSKDNKLIKDPKSRVATVFIAQTSTRFALLHGEPVLMLDPADADVETVAHEMGHVIFQALSSRGGDPKATDAAASKNFTLQIADIYHRLSGTKNVKMKGTFGKDETHAIGLWMVDPSQWKSGGKVEHPWDDPDEFFASAKEAFQTDRAALLKSIKKAVAIDSAVKDPAKELIAALDDFLGSGKLSATTLSGTRLKDAETALGKRTGISKVEDTLKTNPVVQWILDPTTRPVPEKAEAGVSSPTEGKTRPTQPNLVTGPGGVKEKLLKKMDERMREKILESVNDL